MRSSDLDLASVRSGSVRRVRAAGRDLGVRLIVLYKATKAIAQVMLAAGLVALAASGELATLRDVAIQLKEHVASRSSLLVGRALSALLSTRGLHLLEIGLVLDGILSGIEGWSLWRGYRWAEWLVVVATATPVPLEVFEIARSHRASRMVVALLNIAVVLYLARRIARRSALYG